MIEKQLAASYDDGQNVIEIMRDSARELPHYFHFLDVAQALGITEVHLTPPFGRRMESGRAVASLKGLGFTSAQRRAAHNGLFLLHCYQPPRLFRSVPLKRSKGLSKDYGTPVPVGMFQTVCRGFGRLRIDPKALADARAERL